MPHRVKPKVYVAITQPGTPAMEGGGSVILNRQIVRYPGWGGLHYPGDMESGSDSDNWDDAIFDWVTIYQNNNQPFPPSGGKPIYSGNSIVGWQVPAFLRLQTGDNHSPLIVYPFIDTRGWETKEDWGSGHKYLAQHIDLNYWDVAMGNSEHWSDSLINIQPVLSNRQGETPELGDFTGLNSRFNLPYNAPFAIDLWRARLPDDTPVQPYATYIKFGTTSYGGFSLEIPYDGPARLWWRDSQWVTGTVELKPAKGRGARITVAGLPNVGQQMEANEDPVQTRIWIIPIDRGILVVTGKDPGGVGTLYRYPSRFWRTDWRNVTTTVPGVREGPVSILHNAGQFMFTFWPIMMPSYASYVSPVIYLPYPAEANTQESQIRVCRQPVVDIEEDKYVIRADAPSVWIGGQEGSRVPAGAYATEYRTTMYTHTYTEQLTAGGQISENQMNPLPEGTPLTFQTCRSPMVMWNDYWQDSDWYQQAQSAPYVSVKEIRVQGSRGRAGRSGVISLDNQKGGWSYAAQDGRVRRVRVGATWTRSDGTEETNWCIHDGFIDSFQGAEHRDIDLDANIVDAVQRAGTVKVDGDSFVFGGHRIENVFAWICNKLGILWGCEILKPVEGNGGIQYFNFGPPDQPAWLPRDGRPWVDVLKNIATYAGNAGLFMRGGVLYKGCPYCVDANSIPTMRNAIPGTTGVHKLHWWDHLSNGPASPGCLWEDAIRTGHPLGVDYWLTMSAKDRDKLVGLIDDDDVMTHEIEDINAPMIELGDYYNSVVVKGAKYADSDEPITYQYTDWHSVQGSTPYSGAGYPLGRLKQLVLTYDWANTDAIVNRIAKALFMRHAFRPEYARVRIPFMPSAYKGRTFYIAGGNELGVNGKIYRITDVQHQLSGSSGPRSTELTGWWINTYSV